MLFWAKHVRPEPLRPVPLVEPINDPLPGTLRPCSSWIGQRGRGGEAPKKKKAKLLDDGAKLLPGFLVVRFTWVVQYEATFVLPPSRMKHSRQVVRSVSKSVAWTRNEMWLADVQLYELRKLSHALR